MDQPAPANAQEPRLFRNEYSTRGARLPQAADVYRHHISSGKLSSCASAGSSPLLPCRPTRESRPSNRPKRTQAARLIDKKLGSPRPVTPGSYIDDGLGNGALIGALSGVGIVLVESRFRCGDKPDRVPCTGKGLLIDSFRAAMWVALAGLIVDAAIPSKLEGPASAPPMQSQRPFGIRFAVRF